jgi:hypothetical protein
LRQHSKNSDAIVEEAQDNDRLFFSPKEMSFRVRQNTIIQSETHQQRPPAWRRKHSSHREYLKKTATVVRQSPSSLSGPECIFLE